MRHALRRAPRSIRALALLAAALAGHALLSSETGQSLEERLRVYFAREPETVAESAAILPASVFSDTAAESAVLPAREPEPDETPAIAPAVPDAGAAVPDGWAPELTNHTSYGVDPAALFGASVPRLALDGTPEILIVHTHSSEAFTADGEDRYLPSDGMRTLDTKYNVVRLGDELARTLEEAGIGVVHDREINDYPSYSGAYNRMRKRIEAILEENPGIKIVLDVHRDAILDERGRDVALRADVGGEETARVMFVVGTDAGGLSHPDWRKNLSFAATMQGWGEALYPGLMRPIDLRRERFNQHETAGSLIVEIGSAGNTLAEAKRGCACFAQTLLYALGLR